MSVIFIHNNSGLNCSVEGDEPIHSYRKIHTELDNIIFYSRRLEAVINHYVPCGALREGEEIEIHLKKQTRKSDSIMASLPASNYPTYREGKFFKVGCRGFTKGGAIKRILSDNKYGWKDTPLAVFGYNNQTIKEAILEDRRFSISDGFRLKNPNKLPLDDSRLELRSLAKDVVYTVIFSSKKPDSESAAQKPVKPTGGSSEGIGPDVPQTSSVPQSDQSAQTPDIPSSYKTPTSSKFSSTFNNLSRRSQEQIITGAAEDYRRNVMYKDPMPAPTLRLLTQHMDSVALIRYTCDKGSDSGTFFLLTESLGLTCYHVVKLLIESGYDWENNPIPNGGVSFNYESILGQTEVYTATIVYMNQELDFTFLRISKPRPGQGLLGHVAPPPQDGAVSIIGHPGELLKKVDPMCSVINFSKRAKTISDTILSNRSYIHVLTLYNFMLMSNPKLLTYDTCLYGGASGGPVFNVQGKLVAMHTGGYLADTHLKKKSVIEYGGNINNILETAIKEKHLWLPRVEGRDKIHSYIDQFEKCMRETAVNLSLNDNRTDETPMDM